MRFLQIVTFYDKYLTSIYRERPKLATAGFEDQINTLFKDGFSGAHLIAPYLRNIGYDAHLVIANCGPAQIHWMHENGYSNAVADLNNKWFYETVQKQIEKYKPDVLYIADPISFESRFIRTLSKRPSLVVGWRAASIPNGIDWTEFDLMLTNSTICRQMAAQAGAKSVKNYNPGFPEHIADMVRQTPYEWDVVFSGQITPEHKNRMNCLREVTKAPLGFGGEFTIGYFVASGNPEELPSGIAMHNHGPRWGADMYRALKSGRIALNVAIDMAKIEAGNMRLFETTGVGAFLLTEQHDTVNRYFEPGKELATFRSPDELIEKIYYYLEHDEEREEIANRGQERCIRDHGMNARTYEFDELVRKSFRKKTGTARPQAADSTLKTNSISNEDTLSNITEIMRDLNSNNNEEALRLSDKAISLNPSLIGILYGKAIALERMGRHNEAVDCLKHLLSKSPKHKKAAALLKAIQEHATSLEDMVKQAKQYLIKGNVLQAFTLLNQLKAEKNPLQNIDFLRAQCFLKMKQLPSAQQALEEELRYFPANAEAGKILDDIKSKFNHSELGTIKEPEFLELFQKIRPYTMLSEERLYSLFILTKQVCLKDIAGNIAECGVAAGGSTALMAAIIQRYSKRPRFLYAFDSFEGMPPPSEHDKHAGIRADDTGWGSGTCAAPEESVKSICRQLGVSDIVKPVKGYFEVTLPDMKHKVGSLGFLHMDGDWYESTKVILDNLYESILEGGIIQVDDYGFWEGCRKAIHEFEHERSIQFKINKIDSTGVWFYRV